MAQEAVRSKVVKHQYVLVEGSGKHPSLGGEAIANHDIGDGPGGKAKTQLEDFADVGLGRGQGRRRGRQNPTAVVRWFAAPPYPRLRFLAGSC